MEKLAYTENNTVYLNSNLTEELFAKTKSSLLMNEEGLLVKVQKDSFATEKWYFRESKTVEDTVYYTGFDFEGTDVYSLIQENSQKAKEILYKLCELFVYAIKNEINLPCNGLKGILYSKDSFLFLPENLFNRVAMNSGKESYQKIQNEWIDTTLSKPQGMILQLGVISYYAASFKMPFPFTNQEEHSYNLANKNFLPLQYQVNGINPQLAENINRCIETPDSFKDFDLSLLQAELFENHSDRKTVPQDQFLEDAKKYWSKKQKKLVTRSKIEQNKFKFLAFFAGALIIAFITSLVISENGKKPCTIGLTSTETTELFYAGLHTMNSELMIAGAKNCPQAQSYISKIPQISITSLMRGAYNFDSGISTPENILFFEPGSKKFYSHNIYGITNFTIDEAPRTLHMVPPTKHKHPRKITQENGTKLFYKANADHKVHYFLVHTVDLQIVVEEVETLVSLSWEKDRWQISELKENLLNTEIIEPKLLSDQLESALSFGNNDMSLVVKLLKPVFNWIPTEECVLEEKERLDKIGY